MAFPSYPIPAGLHVIPYGNLDIRPDAEVDQDLLNPKPIHDEKNIWFFWHSGFEKMYPYTQRTVRAWHRRFSKQGWVIRVLNRQPSSPLNISNFLDTSNQDIFPRAFTDGTIGGDYAPQHTSDLVRLPLLLKYGGVYADVGLMQIGDLDRLWNETIRNPDSPWVVLSYDAGQKDRTMTNYFLASGRNNPLFERCHRLLLQLWAEDGGKATTDGMHASPLLKGVPPLEGSYTIHEDGKTIGPEEVSKMLTDYIIQGQAITLVLATIDEEDGWDGPTYAAEHLYAIEFMAGAQLINEMTAWDGRKAFDLLSLSLPKEGDAETAEQKQAGDIVEGCLQRSFGFKLAHGLIIRVMGDTLGSLWRKHECSDFVPGTYAHWLRHGMVYWNQDKIPPPVEFEVMEPIKIGPLLEA